MSAHKRQKQEEAESQWGRAFARLEEYREANGDCDVPRDFPDDPSLGSWVHDQRDRHRKGSLAEERMQKLDRLGFQWRTQADITWDEQFARLEAYRDKYGDCQVPHNFAEDQKLSNWVSYQKERIRKGKVQCAPPPLVPPSLLLPSHALPIALSRLPREAKTIIIISSSSSSRYKDKRRRLSMPPHYPLSLYTLSISHPYS